MGEQEAEREGERKIENVYACSHPSSLRSSSSDLRQHASVNASLRAMNLLFMPWSFNESCDSQAWAMMHKNKRIRTKLREEEQ